MADKHHIRKRILENGYLKYIDCVKISERNRDVVRQYVHGVSYNEIAEHCGITTHRVRQILLDFASKAYWYEKRLEERDM